MLGKAMFYMLGVGAVCFFGYYTSWQAACWLYVFAWVNNISQRPD